MTTTLQGGGPTHGIPMTLTKTPSHGDVLFTVFDEATRIAYKPHTGFLGTDNFSAANDLYGLDWPFVVTVIK